jgi:putative tricarboxylic transport membrane protein
MTKYVTRRAMLKGSLGGIAAAALASPSVLRAQEAYPTRPINIIVPFDTGGYNDRLARAFSPFLQQELGQPLTIINRGGAGAMLGHTFFLQQPDDGYSILCTSAAPYIPLNILIQNADFTIDDFHMINLPSRDYTLMATSVESDIESVDDVISRLKEDNTSLSIGIQPASADLVNLMLLLDANGISRDGLRLVTYDGGGPTRNATAGNVVDIGLVGGLGFLPLAEQIKPLVVFDNRSRDNWDAPPVTEVAGAGADFVAGSQRGWVVHASMLESHPDRYETMRAAVEAATKNEAAVAALTEQQLATDWYGPEESNQSFRQTARVMEQHVDLLKGS